MKNVICLSARGMGSRKFGDQIIGADLGDTFHIASKIHIKFRLNSLNQRNIRYVLDKVKRHWGMGYLHFNYWQCNNL